MNNADLNRKLAEALGLDVTSGTHNGAPVAMERDERGVLVRSFLFSPATERNNLAEYVLPEVERRGLDEKFAILLADHMVANRPPLGWPKQYMYILTLPPSVLAAAALKVLGGGE